MTVEIISQSISMKVRDLTGIELAQYSNALQTTFIMEANNLNLDQTAPIKEQSDLGPYCLLYIGCQSLSADEKADDIVVSGRN